MGYHRFLFLFLQKCIKPVKIPTSVGKAKSITIEEDGTYVATNESGEKYTLPKVKIDLNDCLACSGCITTAETILVSQHSTGTFLDMLKVLIKFISVFANVFNIQFKIVIWPMFFLIFV